MLKLKCTLVSVSTTNMNAKRCKTRHDIMCPVRELDGAAGEGGGGGDGSCRVVQWLSMSSGGSGANLRSPEAFEVFGVLACIFLLFIAQKSVIFIMPDLIFSRDIVHSFAL